MNIHREGYGTLGIVLLFLAVLNVLLQFFLPAWVLLQDLVVIASVLLFLLVLYFFRNPRRNIIQNPHWILAPADGRVVVIEETQESEYFKAGFRQVSIFMSPLNVHVNRYPISGRVKYYQYHSGKYLVAWHPKSSTENERNTLVIQHHDGREVLVRQIAGAVARRIVCYAEVAKQVRQGSELGFIKFGSRVDIFIPLEAQIKVKIGDRTIGGETVIAEW
jgi:phosphatidylserine decarboxylase